METSFINALFEALNSVVGSIFFFNVLFFIPGANFPLALAFLLFSSVYFTVRTRFVSFRYFKHAIDLTRGAYTSKDSVGEVTHFTALATALSATIGLGNLAGVAIAISAGGPGATFWMILAGLIGMAAKFAECSLAQMYRKVRPDGHVMGGAMIYLKEGLASLGYARLGAFLAIAFSILCIGGSCGGGGSFQVNQSLHAVSEVIPYFRDHPATYGFIFTLLVGIVILGGFKRIASVADKVVPFMCVLYIGMGLYVLFTFSDRIPWAFQQIFYGAFSPEALYGGFFGVLVTGFRRAAFSNEAGVGSAAIAHSASKTEHPIQEGIVSLLEPFIDTVLICTMTALIIVITGAYNNPEYIDLIHGQNGSALTSRALGEVNAHFPLLLCMVTFMFAYATTISWSYYGERCFTYMFSEKYSAIYRWFFLLIIFLGAITKSTHVMEFGDLMILGMAFPNVIGCFMLRHQLLDKFHEYEHLLKIGKIKKQKA